MHRGGLVREDSEPVIRRMPREIHQDVNLIGAYLLDDLRVAAAYRRPPAHALWLETDLVTSSLVKSSA